MTADKWETAKARLKQIISDITSTFHFLLYNATKESGELRKAGILYLRAEQLQRDIEEFIREHDGTK